MLLSKAFSWSKLIMAACICFSCVYVMMSLIKCRWFCIFLPIIEHCWSVCMSFDMYGWSLLVMVLLIIL